MWCVRGEGKECKVKGKGMGRRKVYGEFAGGRKDETKRRITRGQKVCGDCVHGREREKQGRVKKWGKWEGVMSACMEDGKEDGKKVQGKIW